MDMQTDTRQRLEQLRAELRAERISYGELAVEAACDETDPASRWSL